MKQFRNKETCFNSVTQLITVTLQLLTKLNQRTVDIRVAVQMVQFYPDQQVLHDPQNRGVNDVEINLILKISAQPNKLNTINVKRKDSLVVIALLLMSE